MEIIISYLKENTISIMIFAFVLITYIFNKKLESFEKQINNILFDISYNRCIIMILRYQQNKISTHELLDLFDRIAPKKQNSDEPDPLFELMAYAEISPNDLKNYLMTSHVPNDISLEIAESIIQDYYGYLLKL